LRFSACSAAFHSPARLHSPAGVLLARPSSLSGRANRQLVLLLIARQNGFQPDVDAPSGGEVILVAKRFPCVQTELREQHIARVVIEADAAR
jgi:hypothetical protein